MTPEPWRGPARFGLHSAGLTTGRLTVVVIIAAALLLTLALPLREFLNQRP